MAVDQGGEIFVANGLGMGVVAEVVTYTLQALVGLKLCGVSRSNMLAMEELENGLRGLRRHIAAGRCCS